MVVSYQQELPIEESRTREDRKQARLAVFVGGDRKPPTREVSVKRCEPERSIDYSFRGTEVSKKYKCRARIGAGRTDEIAKTVAG